MAADKDSHLVFSTQSGDLRSKKAPDKLLPVSAPIRISLDTKSRRGKAVTLISNVPGSADDLEKLARQLKALCGAGGSVEGRTILVQGDQREKVTSELKKLQFKVK